MSVPFPFLVRPAPVPANAALIVVVPEVAVILYAVELVALAVMVFPALITTPLASLMLKVLIVKSCPSVVERLDAPSAEK